MIYIMCGHIYILYIQFIYIVSFSTQKLHSLLSRVTLSFSWTTPLRYFKSRYSFIFGLKEEQHKCSINNLFIPYSTLSITDIRTDISKCPTVTQTLTAFPPPFRAMKPKPSHSFQLTTSKWRPWLPVLSPPDEMGQKNSTVCFVLFVIRKGRPWFYTNSISYNSAV